jgi:hypothetical protein
MGRRYVDMWRQAVDAERTRQDHATQLKVEAMKAKYGFAGKTWGQFVTEGAMLGAICQREKKKIAA